MRILIEARRVFTSQTGHKQAGYTGAILSLSIITISCKMGGDHIRDDRYMDSIYLALKRLSVVVKQPMDFQSIVVEFYLDNDRVFVSMLSDNLNSLKKIALFVKDEY